MGISTLRPVLDGGKRDKVEPVFSAANRISESLIECLPDELLTHIFRYLETPPPSASGLLEEPIFGLTNAEVKNLKAISCVSRRWRSVVLASLFKHSRFITATTISNNQPSPMLRDEIQPLLSFIRRYSLAKVIKTFVLVVEEGEVSNNANGFWKLLFDLVNPFELIIIAHAEALGALTSCRVPLHDKWNFDSPCHYLRLQQAPIRGSSLVPAGEVATHSKTLQPATEDADDEISYEPLQNSAASRLRHHQVKVKRERAEKTALFDIRPWSTLLLNEGSFVKAYSTYDYWLRQPPSILAELVGAEETSSQEAYISSTIRDFSYIGIYPQASHFNSLTENLPRLDRLYVQLVPRNNSLENPERMQQVDQEDLWMQRNSCFALLMQKIFQAEPLRNYRYLEVFEFGDVADTDAWQMAVDHVKTTGHGWRMVGNGKFVKSNSLPGPG